MNPTTSTNLDPHNDAMQVGHASMQYEWLKGRIGETHFKIKQCDVTMIMLATLT